MDAALGSLALFALIAVALLFDALYGLHDAANSIATVVSTRVLRPHYAVAWAAFFNFIAFLFFGVHVAQTVGTGIVAAEVVDAAVIFGALMGAIVWNLITWWLGIPSSSSHALIGGLAGAAVTKAGLGAIVWEGLGITAAAIVVSPLLGFFLALLLVLAVSWTFVHSTPPAVDNFFRSAQLLSAALYSLGHGGNDAQKTMGIIAVLLYSQGLLGATFYIPFWVVLICQAAMALGDAGWRVAHRAHHGFADHPAASRAGLLCRGRRLDDALPGHVFRRAGLDHAYDHGRHCRGGCRPQGRRRALECGQQRCCGVDRDAARGAFFGAAFYELYKFLS
jgi:PiT family inorganic phosphate transporter